jgi:hypothetical protein
MNLEINWSVLLLFLVFVASAQRKNKPDTSSIISQPDRIEFEMDDFGMDFSVIGGEETGVLVVQETESRTKDGYNWLFHGVDTTLSKKWTRILAIPFGHYMIGYEYYAGKYYLLFNSDSYRNEEMVLYEFDGQDGEHRKFEINTVFPIQLTFFEIIEDNVVFAGFTNYRPVLLTYNLSDEKPKVVPGFYDNNSEILDIIIDDDAGMFTVVQQERMDNRKFTISVKSFTSSGELIQTNTLIPKERKSLVDGTSTMFLGGFQYVAGTYSKNASQYSRGLYLSKFVNGRQQFIKYHEYADLTNFFGYMNERREQRIKDRIERKARKGKKPNFSYRLLAHDIIQRDGEYLMIAEAYYPRYSNYSSAPGYGWSSFSRFNPSFMGYKYTHAVVVAFDRNGNILWDNSFSIDDVESFSLDEIVVVSNYGDKIVLMYLEDNTIRSKVIKGNQILEGKSISPVRLSYDEDEVRNRNPEVEGLKWWYDRTMYAYGEQRIRNGAGTGGRYYRRVFYINKIQYHLDSLSN